MGCSCRFLLTLNMLIVDEILYCHNLNLMESDLGVTFTKTKLYVTTVNNIFQPLPIFRYIKLHLSCCIGCELNVITWSTKIVKGIGGHPPTHISSATLGKYRKLLDAVIIHLPRFFTLSFLHLLSNELNGVSINSPT